MVKKKKKLKLKNKKKERKVFECSTFFSKGNIKIKTWYKEIVIQDNTFSVKFLETQ